MTDIREYVFTHNTSTFAPLAALVGTRCYPDRLPGPDEITYPAVRYNIVTEDGSPFRTHGGAGGRAGYRVQMTAYAETRDDAWAVSQQIKAAWDGYKDGCQVGSAWLANRITQYSDPGKVNYVICDVMIDFAE